MRVQVPSCILLVLLLFILSCRTFPQTYIPEKIQFRHITKDQGLSDNDIRWVVKDKNGFLWIGTVDGLNRYDGRKFKLFKFSPGDSSSLNGNNVISLCVDKAGTLWIGTAGRGLNKYNPEMENFTRYYNYEDSSRLSNNIVIIFEDISGSLWLGTNHGGLNLFDRKTEKFITYKNIPGDSKSLPHNFIWTMYEDSKGNLWIGTVGGGLSKFNREEQNFTNYAYDPQNPQTIRNNKVPGITEDKSGALWLGTYGGGICRFVYRGDKQSPLITNFKFDPDNPEGISGNEIDFIYVDENDILWFGTGDGGLNRTVSSVVNNPNLKFISYKHDADDPASFLGNSIARGFKDDSGLFWIISYLKGLNVFDAKRKPFRNYRHEPKNPNSLSDGRVTSVYEDESGILWIGVWDGGLNKWDRITNKFINYKNDPKDPFSLNNNRVQAVSGDRSGFIWVGTYNGGISRFDKKKEKFFRYNNDPGNPKSYSDNFGNSFTEDSSGTLWIGAPNRGINKYNRASDVFTNLNNNPDSLKILSSDIYNLIFLIDESGLFWVSNKSNGLYSYDLSKNELVHYKHDPGKANGLRYFGGITTLYEDEPGVFWMGTGDDGLIKFSKTKGLLKRYTSHDGLPGDWITGILKDNSGNMWIGTNNGLSKFNPKTETFSNYDIEDGLLSNQLGSGCKSRTGEFIFTCENGFIIFHPDSIKDNQEIPPVYITDFYLFNKPVPVGYDSLSDRTILNKSITLCKEIELNYDDKVFSFEFAALDFHAPNKNKYAYKMEGFDREWIYVGADYRLITYTNLDPGEYTFRVKASNSDGYWNEAGTSLKIIINPPWYQTSLAYIMYILLTGSIIFIFWKAQLRRIKIRNEYEMSRFETQKLHEVDEIKSRFFANISHEFRTPLTLILGPAKDIADSSNEIKIKQSAGVIKRNAVRLLNLVNQLLDLSRLESGRMKLETKEEDIIPFLKGLVISFSSYSERKKIKLGFFASEDCVSVYLDKDKIEKIINNLLSNAFKFTPEGGKIDVIIEKLTKEIEIRISDSGIGIPGENIDKIFDRFYQVDGSHTREQEGTGIGLSLTKELVELHKGTIEVQSVEGSGTTFIIRIPLGKEHLKPEEISSSKKETERTQPGYDIETERKAENKTDVELLDKESLPLLLIIEDNSDVRNYIKDNLNLEYRIIEAADGEDGWNKSINQIPDLIISDVMMPKMDGFKLCEKLKTDEMTSHIPVILLTAKAAKEDKMEGYETGADDYIMKPFEPDELRARIRNLLLQRKRLHEHFRKHGLTEFDQTKITPTDKIFIKKVYDTINAHISDPGLSMDVFAEHLNISKSLLHKKIVALAGEPPGELIRRIRLKKAAELIDRKFGNLSEIALEVGFNNPAYFSEAFKKQFGIAPSQYQRNNKTL